MPKREFQTHKYTPINPEKYDGNPCDIVMRSSWETLFASRCDKNPSVLSWSSETTVVPYLCPTTGRVHRYFIDFKVVMVDKDGKEKTFLVEVKPDHETRPPQPAKKRTKQYVEKVMRWAKNEAKWKAATKYAEKTGSTFTVLTEYDLGIKKRPK